MALETLNFARDRSGDMAAPYGDVSWIRRWLGHIDNQRIYVPSVLGLLALLLTRTWNRAATLGLVAGLYCLATAPGPRFAFGAAAALTGAGAVALMRWRVSRILMLCCSAGVLLSVASVEAGYTFEAFVGRNTWVTPAPSYLHDAVGRVIWHRGLKVNLPPADDRCGALPVPCTPIPPLPATTLCDVQRGLSGGFCRVVLDRHSVKPDSENTRSPNTDPASAAR